MKEELIKYIAISLNIDISNKIVYLDMVEDLNKVEDYTMFKSELKSRVANLNDDYKYLNGYQKFVKLLDDINSKKNIENNRVIEKYCDSLISKCLNVKKALERQMTQIKNKSPKVWNNFTIDKMIVRLIDKNISYDTFNNIQNGIKTPIFADKDILILKDMGNIKVWIDKADEPSFKNHMLSIVTNKSYEKKAFKEKKAISQCTLSLPNH